MSGVRRRNLLIGAGLLAAGAWWLRPADRGELHNDYFAHLNNQLRAAGLAQPMMLIDQQRLARNCERLLKMLPNGRDYRIVAKSLPSLALIREVMKLTGSRRVMTFHRPFMNQLAKAEPDCDMLLGKPMPVDAAATFYRQLGDGDFNPEQQLQWLIDSEQRLIEYLDLARQLERPMRISIEIDIGLHRGGLTEPEQLDALLEIIRDNPKYLRFAGFMGYDAHVGKLPGLIESTERSLEKANARYREFIQRGHRQFAELWHDDLIFNGAGSPTLALHGDDTPLTELAAGSCLVKPTDFDLPGLADFEPAAFIATPVLKASDGLQLPGPIPLGTLWAAWDINRRRSYFIYGGYWKAKPESPPGLLENGIYGYSSNQMLYNGSASQELSVNDFVFLRPTQSESVLLQFGDLAAFTEPFAVQWWPILDNSAGNI